MNYFKSIRGNNSGSNQLARKPCKYVKTQREKNKDWFFLDLNRNSRDLTEETHPSRMVQ